MEQKFWLTSAVCFLLIILPLSSASQSWWNEGWEYKKTVTITGGSATLTNFPVYVSVAYNTNMQNDFDDLRFVDNTDTTELSYELDSKNDSVSANYWVKIPSLTTGANTIYMYYGNEAVSSTNEGINTFSSYIGFWNFGEETGTKAYSKTGILEGTLRGGITWVDGVFGKGLYFDGNAGSYIDISYSTILQNKNITYETWLSTSDSGATREPGGHGYSDYNLIMNPSGIVGAVSNHANAGIATYCGNPINNGAWHHVALSTNDTGYAFYIDGTLCFSSALNGSVNWNNPYFKIGSRGSNGNDLNWKGVLDNQAVRTAWSNLEWINRTWGNRYGNFVAFGAEEKQIECFSDLDCGTSDWTGIPSCFKKDVLQIYRNITCISPGAAESLCLSQDLIKLKQDCGEDSCEDFDAPYCNGNAVYHKRVCNTSGCLVSQCYSNQFVEEEKIKDCPFECENRSCKIFNVDSPVNNKVYSSKNILLNLSLAEKSKTLTYSFDNISWKKLCKDCQSYSKSINLLEDANNLTLKAETYSGEVYYYNFSFWVDAKGPSIKSAYPSKSINGSFGVLYTENSPVNITLRYGLNNKNLENKKELSNCPSGISSKCFGDINLSAYARGQKIYYGFEVKSYFWTTFSGAKTFTIV